MGEHLLAREHAEYFMEKVMEIITMVKVDPKEALNLAKQQAEAASSVPTTASTTVTTGSETPVTSPTTSRKTSANLTKTEEAETKVI